jgi:hypothetical protein
MPVASRTTVVNAVVFVHVFVASVFSCVCGEKVCVGW